MGKQYYKKIKILSGFVLEVGGQKGEKGSEEKKEYLFLMNWLKYFEFDIEKIDCNNELIKDILTIFNLRCGDFKKIIPEFLEKVKELILKNISDNIGAIKLIYNFLFSFTKDTSINSKLILYVFSMPFTIKNIKPIISILKIRDKVIDLYKKVLIDKGIDYKFPIFEYDKEIFLQSLSTFVNSLRFSEQAFLTDFEIFFQKGNTFSNLIGTKEEEQFKRLLSNPKAFVEERKYLFDTLLRIGSMGSGENFLENTDDENKKFYKIKDKFYTEIEFSCGTEEEVPVYDYFYFPRTSMLIFKLGENVGE